MWLRPPFFVFVHLTISQNTTWCPFASEMLNIVTLVQRKPAHASVEVHGPRRMSSNNFGGPLNFPVAPPSGQTSLTAQEISKCDFLMTFVLLGG